MGAPARREGRTIATSLCVVFVAAIVTITATGAPGGQDPAPEQPPTLRVRTELVELDVTVLDRDARPVSGLTAADFTVLEDGVPQALVAFVPIEVPTWTGIEPAWVRDIGPDVATNRSDARRAVVVILDDFQVRWDPGVTRTAKAIASRAIGELGPADLAAVVYTFDRRKGQERPST
jgi:hypothetical protein